jgi:hypothetical protein
MLTAGTATGIGTITTTIADFLYFFSSYKPTVNPKMRVQKFSAPSLYFWPR